MVIRHDERIARFASASANPAGRLKTGDAAPQIVEQLPLDMLDPDPDQPRRHFDKTELDALAASLRSVGQLQPIVVIRQGDRYRIHIGERRWRAAQRAGLGTIRALVRTTPLEARAARIAQIVENDQRAPLTTSEMVEAVRDLQADGLKGIEIAAALAKPKSRISELVALADAPPELRLVIDALGLGLSYQLLRQWRAHPQAASDFLRLMPVEHVSRLTIATIGEAQAGEAPPITPSEERGTSSTGQLDTAKRAGEGALPRQMGPAPRASSPALPATDAGPIQPRSDTVGTLLVDHAELGEGRVVFGQDASPDHLVVCFADGAPRILHKDDISIGRALASDHGL